MKKRQTQSMINRKIGKPLNKGGEETEERER